MTTTDPAEAGQGGASPRRRWMTIPDFAREFGITENAARRNAAAGKLRGAVRVGGTWRVDRIAYEGAGAGLATSPAPAERNDQ